MTAADPRTPDDTAAPEAAAPETAAVEVVKPTDESPAAAEAAPEAAAPEAAAEPEADPVELAKQALAWCLAHPAEETAVETLNTVFALKDHPEIRRDLLAACKQVGLAVSALEDPPVTLHAHMTVLLDHLLGLTVGSGVADAVYAAWIRNPRSFGRGHLTPPRFQQEVFVQRLGDLLGWGALDLKADHDALVRFAEWVDSWSLRNKFRARRAYDTVRRAFFAPDIWKRVHFSEEKPAGRTQHDKPAAPHADAAPAESTPEGDAAVAATGDGAPAAEGTGEGAGKKKRRRRRRKKGHGEGAAAAGGAEGAAGEDAGGDDAGDDAGDDDGPAPGNEKPADAG